MIELWLKAAKKVGNPIPRLSDRSDVNYSGKFLMRVPRRLHAELVHAAKAQGVSLNQYVLYLLTKGHGARAKREEIRLTPVPVFPKTKVGDGLGMLARKGGRRLSDEKTRRAIGGMVKERDAATKR